METLITLKNYVLTREFWLIFIVIGSTVNAYLMGRWVEIRRFKKILDQMKKTNQVIAVTARED